jgi:hypothetical protein
MKNITLEGYEHYLISEDGKVYNTLSTQRKLLHTPNELKSYPNKNTGYYTVVLRNGIKAKSMYVHRLVASTYIKNPLNLPEVNHINHNKYDNSVSNLEWVTKKQNIQHRNKNGRASAVYNSIINNSELLNEGIELYKKIGRTDVVAELWNISYPSARKVLINCGIQIYLKNTIPLYIKKELVEAYNNNKHWKPRHLKKYALDTYGIKLSGYYLYAIIKNEECMFTISEKSVKLKIIEKNIQQKTVFDFCFDI